FRGLKSRPAIAASSRELMSSGSTSSMTTWRSKIFAANWRKQQANDDPPGSQPVHLRLQHSSTWAPEGQGVVGSVPFGTSSGSAAMGCTPWLLTVDDEPQGGSCAPDSRRGTRAHSLLARSAANFNPSPRHSPPQHLGGFDTSRGDGGEPNH